MKKHLIIIGLTIALVTQPLAWADDFVPSDEEDNSSNTFILDADDTGGDVTLQFGTTLAEFLRYNSSNLSFDLSNKTLVLDAGNTGAGANVSIVANQGTDNDGTLRYNATTNQWEISNDGGTFNAVATGTIATDLPVVQVRQAGAYTLTSATWADITFDTTDLENDATVLEHNNTNTDNIDIKEDGIYMITYNLNLNQGTATHSFDSRVRLNDSTVMNGSVNSNSNYQNEYVATGLTFYANLTAGDFITLQAQRTSANNLTAIANPVLTMAKMEGIKGIDGLDGADGAPGPPGSGSTVNIQEEGSAIPNTPHSVLNFIGSSVTATDAGSGVANINITGDFSGSSSFRVQEGAANPGTCTEGQIFYNTTDNYLYACTAANTWTAQGRRVPDMNNFVDTTADTATSANNTTDYWDGTTPNITPGASTSEILVMGTILYDPNSTADIEVVTRIERNVGSAPTCGSSTSVGQVGWMTSNNDLDGASFIYVDTPATTNTTYYTLCSDTEGTSSSGSILSIEFTLYEMNDAADLAEVYASRDATLQPGEVVSFDPNLTAGVKRTENPYDSKVLGVVSTKPAQLIGGTNGEGITGVPVALSGRVPVKVNTENGPILPGDPLTSSSVPGVAMKATKPGYMIGRAFSEYNKNGIGSILIFVGTHFGNPQATE